MIKHICKKCGYSYETKPTDADKEFAKNTDSKTLVSVWVCPRCGADNTTKFEVSN